MTTAIISDVHANLEALEDVLKAIDERGVRRILCLGDVVGYGASPNECLKLVVFFEFLKGQCLEFLSFVEFIQGQRLKFLGFHI